MRRAGQQDQGAILEYLKKSVAECIYMYIDILNYGVAAENMIVWLQEQEGQIELVVMKYYDSFQVYSHKCEIDVTPVVTLLKEYPVLMVSGRRDIIERMEGDCEDYFATYGSVFDVSHAHRSFQISGGEKAIKAEVLEAAEEDTREIAELICSDKAFRDIYEIDNLARQLAERICTHTGRSNIIRVDGKLVAHQATYAEADGIAVVSGLVVHPEYRNCGFVKTLNTYMSEQLRKERKTAYAFAISNKTVRYHRAIYTECGQYGRLVKRKS